MLRRPRRLLLLLAIVALLLAACGGSAAGTPTASGSAAPLAPSESAAPSPTAAESEPPVPPSASPPADSPSPAIAVDAVVRTAVEGLTLREEPTTLGDSLGTLPNGAPSFVVDGPVEADGYRWFLLSGLGIPQYSGCAGPMVTDPWECPVWFGWAASASADGDPWLVADDVDCPAWPEVVDHEITLGVQRIAYLACFGDEERTLTGFYPLIPDDAGLGGACARVPDDLSWIACNLGYEHVVPTESDQFGTGFVFSVDTRAVAMPERGQWVRLTGRFDHPAAGACAFGDEPARTELQCRAQFVVDAVDVSQPPG